MTTAHDELAFRSLGELGRLLERREVSAVELASLALGRLERHGLELNAVALLFAEEGLAAARRADKRREKGERGSLLGLPYGVKDIIDVRDFPTTCGSAALADRVAQRDATVVARLKRCGSVLVAKLALSELIGLMTRDPRASLHGPARNPWNSDRWAGGSSGGSAIAVAAGLVPFALGSETAGSISAPAAWCGVTGFRPTVGWVSTRGVAPLAPTLDKVGPLARSAADCATVLEAIAGRASARLDSVPPIGSLRLGLAEADFGDTAPSGTRPALREALTAIRTLGLDAVDLALPDDEPYRETLDTIMQAEGATSFGFLLDDDRLNLVSDERARQLVREAPISARDYLRALEARRRLVARIDSVFEHCDVVVTTNFALPWPIPEVDDEWELLPILGGNTAMVWAANLAGWPALFLPAGLGADGLPVGIQIVGRRGSDALLLAVGVAFQSITSWHELRPPIAEPR